jgi:hypothetical protein
MNPKTTKKGRKDYSHKPIPVTAGQIDLSDLGTPAFRVLVASLLPTPDPAAVNTALKQIIDAARFYRAVGHNRQVLLSPHESRKRISEGIRRTTAFLDWFEDLDISTRQRLGGFEPDAERPHDQTADHTSPRRQSLDLAGVISVLGTLILARLCEVRDNLPKGSSGRPGDNNAKMLASELAGVWERATSQPFVVSDTRKTGKTAAEDFLTELLRAIDPKMEPSTLTAARLYARSNTAKSARAAARDRATAPPDPAQDEVVRHLKGLFAAADMRKSPSKLGQ